MIKLLLFAGAVLGCLVIVLQVIWPAIMNKPLFSWFRKRTRLDNAKIQFRVAEEEAEAEELEADLFDQEQERLDQLLNS